MTGHFSNKLEQLGCLVDWTIPYNLNVFTEVRILSNKEALFDTCHNQKIVLTAVLSERLIDTKPLKNRFRVPDLEAIIARLQFNFSRSRRLLLLFSHFH